MHFAVRDLYLNVAFLKRVRMFSFQIILNINNRNNQVLIINKKYIPTLLGTVRKFDFIASPHNVQFSFCLIRERTFANETIVPSRMKGHLSKINFNKFKKPFHFFRILKTKVELL